MDYEENYMTYVENEGCCGRVSCRLRNRRHVMIIIALLIIAIVSLVAGMHNGLTLKKYSSLSLVVGVFFPSIILVFVCLYLAFICGRESFRSSVLSRARNLSGGNHARHNKDGLQYPQINSETRDDLGMRYQFKLSTDLVNDPVETANEECPFKNVYYMKNNTKDYCEAKIARRHFRSFSNSDISREMSQNYTTHSKKLEMSYKNTDEHEDQYSPKYLKYHDAPQHRRFKRSVSDTPSRNKSGKSREDRYVWNTQSLHKLKRDVDRINSIHDSTKESCCKPSYEARTKQRESSFYESNFKTAAEYGNRTRFKEDYYYDRRCPKRPQEYASPQDDVQKKSCYTKSEIRLYSSKVPSYKYKQTLKISSFQPDIKDIKNSGDAVCSSFSEDENNEPTSLSDIFKIERKKVENKGLGSSASEQDARLRRKTIYFPSTSNKESIRSSKEYAHEFCKYSNTGNKLKYQLPSRNEENLGDPESNIQMRFHKR